MIIYVESCYGNAILSGKVSSAGQLKNRMKATLNDIGAEDFISVFCSRYNFDRLPFDENIEWDYFIDLDV